MVEQRCRSNTAKPPSTEVSACATEVSSPVMATAPAAELVRDAEPKKVKAFEVPVSLHSTAQHSPVGSDTPYVCRVYVYIYTYPTGRLLVGVAVGTWHPVPSPSSAPPDDASEPPKPAAPELLQEPISSRSQYLPVDGVNITITGPATMANRTVKVHSRPLELLLNGDIAEWR
jgi:hypothetical protein